MILSNPGCVARSFMAYIECLNKRYVHCCVELSEKDESLIVRPLNSKEDYFRFFINDDFETCVSIYVCGDCMDTVDPCDFNHDMEAMLSHGRDIYECDKALDDLLHRIDTACSTIRSRYIDIPYAEALGMAFNKFLVHNCEGLWESSGKLYFTIKGEELPNGCGYCFDYHNMYMYAVDKDLKVLSSRYAADLSMSYVNDKNDVNE